MRIIYKYTIIILSIIGIVSLFFASGLELNENSGEFIEKGRLNLASLNPISMGHVGVSLFIISLWTAFNFREIQSKLMMFFIYINIIIGIYLIFSANSRGPIISAIMCLFYLLIASRNKVRIYTIIFTTIFLITLPYITFYIEDFFNYSVYSRLFGTGNINNIYEENRLERYTSAINVFIESPLFGSMLEEPLYGGYPHNIFIESLMNVGIIGTFILFILIIKIIVISLKVYRKKAIYSWIPLIFIQYLVGGQFSGALYTIYHLWISMAIILLINNLIKEKKLS